MSNARDIDYRLRLAKSIERRMMCTAFQKLAVIMPLSQYKYVGFGAYYFSDFYLFHKDLGINKMLSIEKGHSKEVKARFEFNKPFECIDIAFQECSHVLNKLTWKSPKIIWLDYTSTLSGEILSDLSTVLRNCKSGTSINISVKADSNIFEPDQYGYTKSVKRLDVLKEVIGTKNVPSYILNSQINQKHLTQVFNKIIKAQIERILTERNLTEKDFEFKQLFNFKYNDGTPMYTFGGIVYKSDRHKAQIEKINFTDLPFINDKDESFSIDIPNLTIKEIKFLESIMPKGINKKGGIKDVKKLFNKNPMIPTKDILKFSKIYQYFPVFSETRIG